MMNLKISLSLPLYLTVILKCLVILLDLSHQSIYSILTLIQSLHLLAVTVFVEDEFEAVVDKWIVGKEGPAIAGPLFWRRKERIHADLENILYHCWYDAL